MENITKNHLKIVPSFLNRLLLIFMILGAYHTSNAQVNLGGVNLGNLPNYHMVFTRGNVDANWQGATKGFFGNIAIDGIQAFERTSGTVPFAGTILTNDANLGGWQKIITSNSGQAFDLRGKTILLTDLSSDLEKTFTQINALSVTSRFNGISPSSLNGLNTQNGIAETFVINITSGFSVSSRIQITGDVTDVFIFRWDSDANFRNGYNGQVKFQSGGAIVPMGGLKVSNFIHVAGDICSSGGGSNPSLPYPQGPRSKNGTGSLIKGGSDFSGGGFFTGYWFTTGKPSIFQSGIQPYGETSPLSNAIFVGGWYSKTTKFSMTSGTSGVYVAPPGGSIGDLVWNDTDGNGVQGDGEYGIGNVIVKLYSCSGPLVSTTTSTSNGSYIFSDLPAGNYFLQFIAPSGKEFSEYRQWDDTTMDSDVNPENGKTNCITLGAFENNSSIDAGLNPYISIGNFVWEDKNRNGIQDAGEEGLVNVIIELRTCSGDYVSSTITDYDGKYLFNNLTPGQYYLAFTLPWGGYVFSAKNSTGNNDKDSDVNPDNGYTSCVTLKAGDYYMKADAGMFLIENVSPIITRKNENNFRIKNDKIDITTDQLAMKEIKVLSYPNPFITSSTLEFQSSQDSPNGSVEIYSLVGSKIASLFNDTIEANKIYKVIWEATNVPNGIYFYKIVCGEKITTGRLILVN